MVKYHVQLAFRGLRRYPKSTLLAVVTMAIGLAATMTTLTLLHILSADPLPGRSQHLYLAWANTLNYTQPTYHSLNGITVHHYKTLTLAGAGSLLAAHKAPDQTAVADMTARVSTAQGTHEQTNQTLLATTSRFFPMFGVALRRGRNWTAGEQKAHDPVAVIDAHLARQLFGTEDAVGRSIQLKKTLFRVVGVSAPYSPQPHFYDLADWTFSTGRHYHESVFLSYTAALDAGLEPDRAAPCDKSGSENPKAPSKSDITNCVWLTYWARLDTSDQVAGYRAYLNRFAAHQQELAGTGKPRHGELYSVPQWLSYQHVVPDNVRLNVWLAGSFLLLCMVNVAGLLAARFLRGSGEIGIRRALGAPREGIFIQHIVEASAISVLGGVLGLPLTFLGLWILRLQQRGFSSLAHLDPAMFAALFALALIVGIVVGVLPAWRASRVEPGLQVKSA